MLSCYKSLEKSDYLVLHFTGPLLDNVTSLYKTVVWIELSKSLAFTIAHEQTDFGCFVSSVEVFARRFTIHFHSSSKSSALIPNGQSFHFLTCIKNLNLMRKCTACADFENKKNLICEDYENSFLLLIIGRTMNTCVVHEDFAFLSTQNKSVLCCVI